LIADSSVGYLNVNPAFCNFSELTVALFKTSVLISPNTAFNAKTGTCNIKWRLFVICQARVRVSCLLLTGYGETTLNTPERLLSSRANMNALQISSICTQLMTWSPFPRMAATPVRSGFLNSFNSFYGKVKKISYYTFVQYKQGTGWRPRSAFDQQTAHASVKYQINENISIKAEYTYNHYLAQQAGGLTDKDFYKDPSQSKRSRNWFKVDWNLFAAELDYKISDRTKLSWVNFGLLAGRDALGYLGRADRPDDTTKNRDLLQDDYKNFGSELRFLHRYKFLKGNSVFLVGSRYYNGNTYRKQGSANASSKAEFAYVHPDRVENSDYLFARSNVPVFTENLCLSMSRFSVTPG